MKTGTTSSASYLFVLKGGSEGKVVRSIQQLSIGTEDRWTSWMMH